MEPMPDFDWDALAFSFTPTDTMYVTKAKTGEPWKTGSLMPYGDISISPAAGVLNYGQGIFEGIKAQRTAEGKIVLFRPDCNAARCASGARRMGMPEVPEEIFVAAIQDVVRANARWVPPSGRGALYIRPMLFGNGPILGVSPAPEFTFMIYCCPVGPYFKGGGMASISLKVSDEFHRACGGGAGGVKAVGNYAPGMIPAMQAKKEGFAEIIYLDAKEHRYVEEVGAANFFCIKDGKLYTPELSGSILPGVTRMTVLALAKELGHEVEECKLDISFALTADEAFCCGTAAVMTPIETITHGENVGKYHGAGGGPITKKLYENLLGIQLGRLPDKNGWVKTVEPN
jgi:branched-chain amino acid aminotransferase